MAAPAAALPGAPFPPPGYNPGIGGRFAHGCGALVHSLILSLGLVFTLHVAKIHAALSAQGHWSAEGSMTSGLWDAAVVLLKTFTGASFLDPMIPESTGMDVWGFWVPGLLSLLLLTISLLGLATLRQRRPSRAIPYALLAAALLTYQVQVSQALMEVATWEDLSSLGAAMPQKVQQYLFKSAHEAFAKTYAEQKCRALKRADGLHVVCSGEGMEAKFMPLIMQEFCKAREDTDEAGFEQRAKTCQNQGERMRLLPLQEGERPRDALFCRCWTASFEALKSFARWVMLLWFGLLLGVLSVLYVASEPKLAQMCPTERREVLLFAAGSMALLAARVTMLPEGLPWLQGGLPEE